MKDTSLTVVSPSRRGHADAVVDLCAKTFGSYFVTHRGLTTHKLVESHYDWEASSIGLMDGQVATHFGVWDYQMRIGRARVRCGGIGYVATHGDFRKRGLMAQTVPHTLRKLRERGYDFSLLFGISDFYHRFGYVPAWADSNWTIRLEHLPAGLPPITAEKFDPQPRADIAQLHNRECARLTGTAVRPSYPGAYYFPGTALEGYLWKNSEGQVAGHVLAYVNGGRLACIESTGDTEAVLAVLAGLARQKLAQEIMFEKLHDQSRMARRLRRLTCRCETAYVRDGGAMVRIVNLASALGKLRGELEVRLRESELADYRGELLLASAEEKVVLSIGRGRISVSAKGSARNSISGAHLLARLLLGSDEPRELCEQGGIRLRGDAGRLLPVLFPAQHPQLHYADRF